MIRQLTLAQEAVLPAQVCLQCRRALASTDPGVLLRAMTGLREWHAKATSRAARSASPNSKFTPQALALVSRVLASTQKRVEQRRAKLDAVLPPTHRWSALLAEAQQEIAADASSLRDSCSLNGKITSDAEEIERLEDLAARLKDALPSAPARR